jgi:hypothetical protein
LLIYEFERFMSLSAAIAIVTLDRHQQLAETLNHLSGIDLSRLSEILVVDQTDSPFDLGPWQPRFSVPLRLVHLQVKGLCVARNQALEKTQADVIIYIDDDVIPDVQLVNQHLQTYEQFPHTLGVAGYEELPEGVVTPGKKYLRNLILNVLRPFLRWSKFYRQFLDIQGYPVAIIAPSGLFLADFSRPYPCRVMTPRGCNMSFLRSGLLKIGGFDEGHRGNVRREESDASLRLLKAFPEGEIWFNPKAKLMHLMSPTGGCRFKDPLDWYKHLFMAEARFARRHLSNWGYRLFCLRLTLMHGLQVIRNPQLLKILLDPGQVDHP